MLGTWHRRAWPRHCALAAKSQSRTFAPYFHVLPGGVCFSEEPYLRLLPGTLAASAGLHTIWIPRSQVRARAAATRAVLAGTPRILELPVSWRSADLPANSVPAQRCAVRASTFGPGGQWEPLPCACGRRHARRECTLAVGRGGATLEATALSTNSLDPNSARARDHLRRGFCGATRGFVPLALLLVVGGVRASRQRVLSALVWAGRRASPQMGGRLESLNDGSRERDSRACTCRGIRATNAGPPETAADALSH